MKRRLVAAVGVLVVAALALVPAARDEAHWRWASLADHTGSYESYVRAWPEGRHADEARTRYDEHGWADARATDTVRSFEDYVQRHPAGKHVAEANEHVEALHWQEASAANSVQGFEQHIQRHGGGKHAGEARDKIESLHWKDATTADTVSAFERYLELHGDGRHVAEARERVKALRAARAPYDDALRGGSEESLKTFLAEFPGHVKEAEARQVLRDMTEGRDIVDLVREKKIEVKTEGGGIQSVTVGIRRRVPYPLTVRIPVGTYFVSANPSSQNMVSTEETSIRVVTEDWEYVSPDAACANRPRDIPSSDDRFTIRRAPQQADLAQLMPVLEKAGVPYCAFRPWRTLVPAMADTSGA